MTRDSSHLVALRDGLAREKARLLAARSPHEVALRQAWVAQREREIAEEERFLGLAPLAPCSLSDDELAAELE